MDALDQIGIDKLMIELDGTPNKGKLGQMPYWVCRWQLLRLQPISWVFPLSVYRRCKCKSYAGTNDEHTKWWRTCR